MTTLQIICGIVLGGLVIVSALKGSFSILVGRGEPPRRYEGYVSSAIRGRDPFKGPGKPLLLIIGGGLLTLLLWILGVPQKIAKWALSKSEKAKKHPNLFSFLSYTIAVLFWMIFITVML